jgi:predicted nucleic acid-binding protein
MAFYVDSSAILKLAFTEPESVQLREWLTQDQPVLVGSDLVRTETIRAVRRTFPEQLNRALTTLGLLNLLRVTPTAFRRASDLGPESLRSLDALHLASALELGEDLEGMITYDSRLTVACARHGVRVVAPA